jgi:uncharacterized damage-inducible protein DinB
MEMPSSISTRLQYQHKSLMDVMEGLTDEQIRRPIITGKWSIFENIVHLQSYQHTFIKRLRQILENKNPTFPRYSAEGDPEFLDNVGKSTREVIGDLLTVRKLMAAEIIAFPSTDLVKTGIHPAFGQMTLLQWMNFFLLHEAHHLFAIFKLAVELKKK